MAQYHDAPARYLALMREALPLYDALQDAVVAATAGLRVGRLLDLGIGTGETARRCLDAHPHAQVVGVDTSAAMLEIATETVPGAELHAASLADPLPPGPFDLVVASLSVHHLDGPGKAGLFGRIAGALAPGGRFVMADVIEPEAPVAHPTPLDRAVDLPDRVPDLLAWLGDAGLAPTVRWAEQDLVVVSAER